MTVAELLQLMIERYQGATPESLKAVKSSYYKRLEKHEGDLLANAWDAIAGEFKANYHNPFPLPADFEKHLPSGKLNLGPDSGPRVDLAGHHERKKRLIVDWQQRQKPKIAEHRGPIVAMACQHMAECVADFFAWSTNPYAILLTTAQIDKCQERAITQERARQYGPIPEDPEVWRVQYDKAKAAILAGKRLKREDERRDEPETVAQLLDRIGKRAKQQEAFDRDFEQGPDGKLRHVALREATR